MRSRPKHDQEHQKNGLKTKTGLEYYNTTFSPNAERQAENLWFEFGRPCLEQFNSTFNIFPILTLYFNRHHQ